MLYNIFSHSTLGARSQILCNAVLLNRFSLVQDFRAEPSEFELLLSMYTKDGKKMVLKRKKDYWAAHVLFSV